MENIKSKFDVIELIASRDNINYEEAKMLVEEVIDMMIDEPWAASDIIMDELGLEPDYIEYLLY